MTSKIIKEFKNLPFLEKLDIIEMLLIEMIEKHGEWQFTNYVNVKNITNETDRII